MRKTIKANDYLYISGRIHAMENRILTRERMERMLDAATAAEAAKVLSECGYGEMSAVTPTELEQLLARQRVELFRELGNASPDPGLMDVFRMKYDYHNAKVLMKAEAMGRDGGGLLVDAGRYPVSRLEHDYHEGDLSACSSAFAAAVAEAKEVLGRTGDPQRSDFVLDRAYYEELRSAAGAVGSKFLTGYVRLCIDAANLRSAVRAARMGKDMAFLQEVLLSGGNVDEAAVAAAALGEGDLAALYQRSGLEEAGKLGAERLNGGSMTAFEKACDDAVTRYLTQGRRVNFGEHPLIGYVYAREAELTTIRIILTGKMAGLSGDVIRERLRESYV